MKIQETKFYDVTIRATVYKTLRIEATDEEEAYVLAHEEFDVTCTDDREKYEEETMRVEEVKP